MKQRNLLFVMSFILICINSMQDLSAIRAKKDPFVITQPDGSKLTLRLNGDEFHRYRTTEDGILVKENANGYYTCLLYTSPSNQKRQVEQLTLLYQYTK